MDVAAGCGVLAPCQYETCFATTSSSNEGREIMRSYMWTAVLLAAALLVTGDAKTQQQPAAGEIRWTSYQKRCPSTRLMAPRSRLKKRRPRCKPRNRGGQQARLAVKCRGRRFRRQSCHVCSHGWRTTCLHCHLRAQGTGRSKISSANQSDRRRRSKRSYYSHDTGRRDRLTRRRSANRGRQAHWRDRLLWRYRVSGRGGVFGRCGFDQQIAAVCTSKSR